jgi:Tfp pilus assembly protein PilF
MTMDFRVQIRLRWERFLVLALVLTAAAPRLFSVSENDWIVRVREQVAAQHLAQAEAIVEQRLQTAPEDLEAQAWLARLLAWNGKWQQAEAQYRSVLRQAPNDVDVLMGLADVLLWEGKLDESSALLEHAQELQPANTEVSIRRTRLAQARQQQKSAALTLRASPQTSRKSSQKNPSNEAPRYSVNVDSESDLFSFTSPIQAQSASLSVNWNSRWTSSFTGMSYRRLGIAASELSSAITWRATRLDAISFSFGEGSHQSVAPLRQMSLDYDRGLNLHAALVKGLEITAHSASVWFEGSQVTVLGASVITYLPRESMWSFTANQARTDFYGTGSSWSPAASSKLSFPVWSRLRMDAGFGVGAENYSNIDQIGRISARTYLGGAHYRINHLQDFSAFVAYQQRSRGQTQTSIGGGYGFHF